MKRIMGTLAVFAALVLASPSVARAVTVTRVGYRTGAIADRSQYDQVLEAEDLVRAGQYCGSTVVPWEYPWMVWIMGTGACVWGTFTAPSDTIVFQTAGSDSNDGQMLTYVDGELVDSVDLYPAASGGAAFYVEVSGLPLGTHSVQVVAGLSASGSWANHIHFDFIAARNANEAPVVTASDVAATEGSLAANVISASDPDGDPLAITVSEGTLTARGPGEWLWSATYAEGPSRHTVEVTADDGAGGVTTTSFVVDVANAPPAIAEFSGTPSPVALGAAVAAQGAFADAGALDTHTAVIEWGDGTSSAATVVEAGGAGTFSAAHVYAQPGLYTLRVVVTDDDGGAAAHQWSRAVVYDPDGSFVTGGGWFASPDGALASDPWFSGRANLGLVVKYGAGEAPKGALELHLDGDLLKLRATAFDWFVVSGPDAFFAGTATVDGGGEYAFSAVATDGGEGGPDAFGIEVRDAAGAVVYDSLGARTLGGGSVQLH